MSEPTLVFIRAAEIGGAQFHFGSECPPGLLTGRQIEKAIDGGWLKEYQVRSLYRTFRLFSGATREQPLTREQIDKFCLQE